MKDFLVASRRDILMSKRSSLKIVQGISILFGLTALLVAPWGLPMIDNALWRISAWVFILLLVAGIAISFGLAPYFGQKEITKDSERRRDEFEKWMWEARSERDKLEQEIAQLKQKH